MLIPEDERGEDDPHPHVWRNTGGIIKDLVPLPAEVEK